MQIKSTIGYKGQLLFCGTILCILDIAILISEGICWFSFYMLFFSLLFIVYSICIWMAYGRTFLFDKSGCTVTLGKYRRHYDWQDLKVIQYHKSNKRSHYTRTEVRPQIRLAFFRKDKYVPHVMGIETYCILFHPLSCIFVGFLDHSQEKKTKFDEIYIAPKEEFFTKLKEWNVYISTA